MSSTRLPGKVLLPLGGEPVLFHVAERVRRAKGIDTVVIATTTDTEDDAIAGFCAKQGYACFRGSRDDVLSRYFEAARQFGIDTVVRITSDCPLIDPDIVAECIAAFQKGQYDYVSNINPGPRTFPRGLDCEVFSREALERAHKEARGSHEREHVTPYIWEHPDMFSLGETVTASSGYARSYRLTLDYPEDYEVLQHVYTRFYKTGSVIQVTEVLAYLDEHQDIAERNMLREKDHERHAKI